MILRSLLKFMSHRVGDAIQPSHPLWSSSPPAFNLSQHQGLFQRGISSHQVPKYWSFNFSISPSNEYSALISFRMDWLDAMLHLIFKKSMKNLLSTFRRGCHCFHFYRKIKNSAESSRVNKLKR